MIALIASLALMAFPKANAISAYLYLQAASHQLQRALNRTRIEAITHNQTMLLCPRGSTLQCVKVWTGHLLMMPVGEANLQPQSIDLPGPQLRVFYRGFPSSEHVMFKPSGLLNQQNGTFRLSYQVHHIRYQQKLIVSRTGRIRKTSITAQSV